MTWAGRPGARQCVVDDSARPGNRAPRRAQAGRQADRQVRGRNERRATLRGVARVLHVVCACYLPHVPNSRMDAMRCTLACKPGGCWASMPRQAVPSPLPPPPTHTQHHSCNNGLPLPPPPPTRAVECFACSSSASPYVPPSPHCPPQHTCLLACSSANGCQPGGTLPGSVLTAAKYDQTHMMVCTREQASTTTCGNLMPEQQAGTVHLHACHTWLCCHAWPALAAARARPSHVAGGRPSPLRSRRRRRRRCRAR